MSGGCKSGTHTNVPIGKACELMLLSLARLRFGLSSGLKQAQKLHDCITPRRIFLLHLLPKCRQLLVDGEEFPGPLGSAHSNSSPLSQALSVQFIEMEPGLQARQPQCVRNERKLWHATCGMPRGMLLGMRSGARLRQHSRTKSCSRLWKQLIKNWRT